MIGQGSFVRAHALGLQSEDSAGCWMVKPLLQHGVPESHQTLSITLFLCFKLTSCNSDPSATKYNKSAHNVHKDMVITMETSLPLTFSADGYSIAVRIFLMRKNKQTNHLRSPWWACVESRRRTPRIFIAENWGHVCVLNLPTLILLIKRLTSCAAV